MHPYTGGVSVHDENRAAHGGVRVVEECRSCGARRDVNVNGRHREEGAWGPSREQRRAQADAAASRARRLATAIGSVTLRRPGREVVASVDAKDGMLVLRGEHHDREIPALLASLPDDWRSRARVPLFEAVGCS